MKKTYERPLVVCAEECAEGIFLASGGGRKGTVLVKYDGVWDRWTNGGKGLLSVSCTGVEGAVTIHIHFNQEIDQVEVTDASVSSSISGSTVTLQTGSGVPESMTVGVHLNHEGASIDSLNMTSFDWQ